MGYWKEYEIERDEMIVRGYIPPMSNALALDRITCEQKISTAI